MRRLSTRLKKRSSAPLAHPDSPSTPVKELYARKTKPVPFAARSIGFYSHGCLAGAVALPIDGSTWQVMRLSRNRNWGHPQLIDFLERLAGQAKKIGRNGLLVGDLSQPRGGPMLSDHTSHQVGLPGMLMSDRIRMSDRGARSFERGPVRGRAAWRRAS